MIIKKSSETVINTFCTLNVHLFLDPVHLLFITILEMRFDQ